MFIQTLVGVYKVKILYKLILISSSSPSLVPWVSSALVFESECSKAIGLSISRRKASAYKNKLRLIVKRFRTAPILPCKDFLSDQKPMVFWEDSYFLCTFCDQLSIQYNPKTPQFRRTRDFSKRKFKPEILSCSSEVNRKTICHQNGRRSTRNWSVFNNLNNIYYLWITFYIIPNKH